jgi:uncharacterized protein (DUF4415 family)
MWGWLEKLVQRKKPARTALKQNPERINSSTLKRPVQHKNKKRGRGRPPILHKTPTSRMDIRIDSILLGKFRDYCERHNTSMTHAMTLYMQRAIAEEEFSSYKQLATIRLKPKRKSDIKP